VFESGGVRRTRAHRRKDSPGYQAYLGSRLGGGDHYRLKWKYNKLKIKGDVRHALNNVPLGESLFGVYRKFKEATEVAP